MKQRSQADENMSNFSQVSPDSASYEV